MEAHIASGPTSPTTGMDAEEHPGVRGSAAAGAVGSGQEASKHVWLHVRLQLPQDAMRKIILNDPPWQVFHRA